MVGRSRECHSLDREKKGLLGGAVMSDRGVCVGMTFQETGEKTNPSPKSGASPCFKSGTTSKKKSIKKTMSLDREGGGGYARGQGEPNL